MLNVNSELDFEQAEEIAMEFDVLVEMEEQVDVIEELLKEEEEDPKGTTIEAVRVLEEKGLRSAVFEAMKACVKKGREV